MPLLEDLWEKAITGVTLLLLSPEQLSLRSFDNLLQKKVFWKRIAGLGLDESVRSGDGVLNKSTRKNTIQLYFSWL